MWFDVEKGYITTGYDAHHPTGKLWFDVEKGYITTVDEVNALAEGCGLM